MKSYIPNLSGNSKYSIQKAFDYFLHKNLRLLYTRQHTIWIGNQGRLCFADFYVASLNIVIECDEFMHKHYFIVRETVREFGIEQTMPNVLFIGVGFEPDEVEIEEAAKKVSLHIEQAAVQRPKETVYIGYSQSRIHTLKLVKNQLEKLQWPLATWVLNTADSEQTAIAITKKLATPIAQLLVQAEQQHHEDELNEDDNGMLDDEVLAVGE